MSESKSIVVAEDQYGNSATLEQCSSGSWWLDVETYNPSEGGEGEMTLGYDDLKRLFELLKPVMDKSESQRPTGASHVQPEATGWVSVEDRLPDNGELVLGVRDLGDEFRLDCEPWDEKFWRMNNYKYWQYPPVPPLPQPPQEGE